MQTTDMHAAAKYCIGRKGTEAADSSAKRVTRNETTRQLRYMTSSV
jgi:hypothetical protein